MNRQEIFEWVKETYWLLVVAAVLFGIGHIYITVQNHK